jgi:hypothetical protein
MRGIVDWIVVHRSEVAPEMAGAGAAGAGATGGAATGVDTWAAGRRSAVSATSLPSGERAGPVGLGVRLSAARRAPTNAASVPAVWRDGPPEWASASPTAPSTAAASRMLRCVRISCGSSRWLRPWGLEGWHGYAGNRLVRIRLARTSPRRRTLDTSRGPYEVQTGSPWAGRCAAAPSAPMARRPAGVGRSTHCRLGDGRA